jgi:hypothetical protein
MSGKKLRSRAELNLALEGLGSPPARLALRAQRPPDRRAGHRRRHARALANPARLRAAKA